jgi:hypothetical protein
MLSVLSACASVSTPRTATSDYCLIARPITYNSKLDSAPTVGQIEAYDSQWVCVCEGDCPKAHAKP